MRLSKKEASAVIYLHAAAAGVSVGEAKAAVKAIEASSRDLKGTLEQIAEVVVRRNPYSSLLPPKSYAGDPSLYQHTQLPHMLRVLPRKGPNEPCPAAQITTVELSHLVTDMFHDVESQHLDVHMFVGGRGSAYGTGVSYAFSDDTLRMHRGFPKEAAKALVANLEKAICNKLGIQT